MEVWQMFSCDTGGCEQVSRLPGDVQMWHEQLAEQEKLLQVQLNGDCMIVLMVHQLT